MHCESASTRVYHISQSASLSQSKHTSGCPLWLVSCNVNDKQILEVNTYAHKNPRTYSCLSVSLVTVPAPLLAGPQQSEGWRPWWGENWYTHRTSADSLSSTMLHPVVSLFCGSWAPPPTCGSGVIWSQNRHSTLSNRYKISTSSHRAQAQPSAPGSVCVCVCVCV